MSLVAKAALDIENRHYFVADVGVMAKLSGERLRTFLKGLSCVSCGVTGQFFAVDVSKSGSIHMNLYAVGLGGEEILMTSDHIVPKSKNGPGHDDNRQPMCWMCNFEKGDRL